MYYVYVLKSSLTQKHYTGLTKDLERRLKEHNSGKTKSTKHGKPWNLIYKEELLTLQEARKREIYLKSGSGREFIKKWLRSIIG
ncbi:MAG: GIY-YIG nuclease family protein [Chlorobi bacterium]|nr:GIY-YIG nuclease family protein [Chlorobiota bacterium]